MRGKGAARVMVVFAAIGLVADTTSEAGILRDVVKKTTGVDLPQTPKVFKDVDDWRHDRMEETWTEVEEQADTFLDNPLEYPLVLAQELMGKACASPVRLYEEGLRAQAAGRWKGLPEALIQGLAGDYNVNLRGVRYAEGVATSNGHAQTIGDSIYFPVNLELANPGDMFWLLHELEHTVQFAGARGGTDGKLCEYLFKAIGNGFEHDRIDMERAADRKAGYLLDKALRLIHCLAAEPAPEMFGGNDQQRQIWVGNDLDIPVVFTFVSGAYPATPITLAPRHFVLLDAPPMDPGYGITVETGGRLVQYSVSGGMRLHLAWNLDLALIDLFRE